MIYIINCPCCGLRITDEEPKGIVDESGLSAVCNSMRSKRSGAWCAADTDLEGLAGFLCDGEALAAEGITDEDEDAICALHDEVQLQLMARDIEQEMVEARIAAALELDARQQ